MAIQEVEKERIVSPVVKTTERSLDHSLRPQKLDEFVGQEQLKKNLQVFMQAAKKRKEPVDHVLLYGPPGLGKTTLAHLIAAEMGVNIRVTSGPALERAGDLGSILTNLRDGDILFIDEIHRLNPLVEEVLYPAMEDFGLDIIIGKGPAARSLRIDLPQFTLIGATTRIGLLSSPLRDRFGALYQLNYYADTEIEQILSRSSKILGITLEKNGCAEIAKRARKTARIANRLLKRVRDFADMQNEGIIDKDVARTALEQLAIDEYGLDQIDRKILETIIGQYDGGPVGINAIAASTSEENETIEEVIEPFLLQIGFMARTPRGRIATQRAYEHLGIPVPNNHQSNLLA